MKQTLIIIFAAISFNCFSQPSQRDLNFTPKPRFKKIEMPKYASVGDVVYSSRIEIYNAHNCTIDDIDLINITLERCNNISVKNKTKYLNCIPLHVADKQNLTYTWNGNFWEVEIK